MSRFNEQKSHVIIYYDPKIGVKEKGSNRRGQIEAFWGQIEAV